MMIKINKGFTLVELLVVVSILGILATIGLTIYTPVNIKSRDAKRQADLKIIQAAAEQYYVDNNQYPQTIVSGGSISGGKVYLPVVPSDPQSTTLNYIYSSRDGSNNSCNAAGLNICIKYCLYTKLEGVSTTQGPSYCNFNAPYNNYNYAVGPSS